MTAAKNKGPIIGQRHLQSFLLFLAIVVNYTAKFNASIAVVAMTNAESTNQNFDEYDWNEMERSYIISSFFWGYVMTQFLGGWLCRRYGAKIVMFYSTMGSAILATLPPFCVPWGGWQIYCGISVGMGLFQGSIFPCIYAHLALWSPVEERNRLGALANSGIDCGTLVAMFLSGFVAASSIGWPGISYVSGLLGICWCIIWYIFAANTPKESKLITAEELFYIENSIQEEAKNTEMIVQIPVPWRAIASSGPFWALLIVRCAWTWGFSTLQGELPAYMNGILLMDMKSNALYSALPYLASWIMSFVFLIISDILMSRELLTLTALRKSFNSIAFWIPALGLIGISFLSRNQKTLAIILTILSVGINSGTTIGSAINTIDLSPNHAGVLMGITNTAANMVPIVTPLIVGVVVTDEHNRLQWQIIFVVAAAVLFFGNLIYIIFGKMSAQPWNAEDFLIKNANKTEMNSDEKFSE